MRKKLSKNRGYPQSTPGCQGMDAASLLLWRLNPGVLAGLPDQRPHLCFGPGCQCWSLHSRWPSDPQGGYSSPSHHRSTVAMGTESERERERESEREKGHTFTSCVLPEERFYHSWQVHPRVSHHSTQWRRLQNPYTADAGRTSKHALHIQDRMHLRLK